MRDVRLCLDDMVKAMEAARSFVEGMAFEEFLADDRTASAVVRKLEIIGEAARAVPDDVRSAHPELPWRAMAGMRDRLICAHFGVDHELVWSVLTDRIPEAIGALREMLQPGAEE